MGRGIAQVAAQSGMQVTLCDVSDEAVRTALERMRGSLDRALARGKIDQATYDGTIERVKIEVDVATAARSADLVIEAVPESLDLKREIFSRAAEAVGSDVVLASNTSSLSIARIAEGMPNPERFVGMHFFNPVPAMALLEVVVHDGTSEAALAVARQVAERMGKTAITVRDAPGFASSRLGIALGMEAIRMVEDGVASAADIDTAMKLGYRHPMGPLELTDLVGLDVRLAISEYLARTLGERFAAPELLRRMVAEGKLGAKSGQGFYRWQDGKRLN